MKITKSILTLVLLVTMGIGSAWADWRGHVDYRGHRSHGSRAHIDLMFGIPWGPWYYPPAYYYPPYYAPQVIIERQPQVYIERTQEPAPPPPSNYWYYCEPSRAYYPYVKECPEGWLKVPPQPSGQQ